MCDQTTGVLVEVTAAQGAQKALCQQALLEGGAACTYTCWESPSQMLCKYVPTATAMLPCSEIAGNLHFHIQENVCLIFLMYIILIENISK